MKLLFWCYPARSHVWVVVVLVVSIHPLDGQNKEPYPLARVGGEMDGLTPIQGLPDHFGAES